MYLIFENYKLNGNRNAQYKTAIWIKIFIINALMLDFPFILKVVQR